MTCRHSCGKHHVIMAESYYEETTEAGCDTCHKGDHPSGPSAAAPSTGTKAHKGTPAPITTQLWATTAVPATTTGKPTTAVPTPGVACAPYAPDVGRLSTRQCRESLQLQSQLLPACRGLNSSSAPAALLSAYLSACSASSRGTSTSHWSRLSQTQICSCLHSHPTAMQLWAISPRSSLPTAVQSATGLHVSTVHSCCQLSPCHCRSTSWSQQHCRCQ